MGILGRIKAELRSAGTAAKGALDEGKVRIEIFRVRQSADAAAQALGYAVHRARREGRELDADTLRRLDAVLAGHEAEAMRLETDLARHRGDSPPASAKGPAPGAGTADGTGEQSSDHPGDRTGGGAAPPG